MAQVSYGKSEITESDLFRLIRVSSKRTLTVPEADYNADGLPIHNNWNVLFTKQTIMDHYLAPL